jgi:hypothetical protein
MLRSFRCPGCRRRRRWKCISRGRRRRNYGRLGRSGAVRGPAPGSGTCIAVATFFPRTTIGLLLSSKAIFTIPLPVAFLPLPLTSPRFFLPLPVTLLPLNFPLLPRPLDLCIGSAFADDSLGTDTSSSRLASPTCSTSIKSTKLLTRGSKDGTADGALPACHSRLWPR